MPQTDTYSHTLTLHTTEEHINMDSIMRWSLDECPAVLPEEDRLELCRWIRHQQVLESQPLLPGAVGSEIAKLGGGHLLVPTPIIKEDTGKKIYIFKGPLCGNAVSLFKSQGTHPRIHEALLYDTITKVTHTYVRKDVWIEFARKYKCQVVTILCVSSASF